MKKIFTLMSVMCVFAFACTQKPQQLNVEVVDFQDQTENLTVEITRNVMSSEDAAINESCVVFNGHVEDFVAMLHEKAKEQAFALLVPTEEPETETTPEMNYFTVHEEVLRADSHYISLLVTVQNLMAGADIVSESFAFNYDVAGRSMIMPTDFIDFTKSGAIDEAILNHFANPESCFTATPTLEAATAINFSTEALVFTYDPTILGPVECGGLRIVVPIAEIRDAFLIKK